MTRTHTGWCLRGALAAAALLAGSAFALDAPPPQVAACQACHGADGISLSADIPNLAGQKAVYLARQLKAFHDGQRKNELMAAIAGQLDAEQIKALADWWSRQPASGAPAVAGAASVPHAATVSHMVLPTDFPAGFTVYLRTQDAESKSLVLTYANAAALAAARAGRPLPDGAAIIVASHAALLDESGKPLADAQGRWRTGALQSLSGMEARAGWGDAIPAVLRNANWNYGLWKPDGSSRLGALQPRCLACHKPRADDSYIFSLPALKAAAP